MGICSRRHKIDVPDEAWAEFYCRLVASGRERPSFYCLPPSDPAGFVNRVRGHDGPWWLLFWKGRMAGCAYLSDILGKSACVHYAFLPLPDMRHDMRHEDAGIAAPAALARFCLSFMLHDGHLDGTPFLDSLVGKTPVWNRAAVKLLPRIGATILGEIPSICYCHDSGRDSAGVISYFTKATVHKDWLQY